METLDDRIKRFLEISSGSGSGYGSGSGSGSGDGYGDGYGLKTFNGHKVYMIDDVATLIYGVHGNMAIGVIVQRDLTLKPCYIAKVGNCFAHGDTAHQAAQDANSKYLQYMPEEERINAFIKAHPNKSEKYPASDLFEWHNTLTGSCRMGRENFCKERGINIEEDSFTIEEFVELTKDSYGGDIIKQILEAYE